MQGLSRLVLVRHGETLGRSSIRFHGRGDVALSTEGREQAREARRLIPGDAFGLVAASPLMRAWQTAAIVARGRPVRLEAGFREIDFGRWEGLTKEEIAERDPDLYRVWQSRSPGFDFPDGEPRAVFRSRVRRGLERLCEERPGSMLVVAHKGVVRTLVECLVADPLPEGQPSLGGVVSLSRDVAGAWTIRAGDA